MSSPQKINTATTWHNGSLVIVSTSPLSRIIEEFQIQRGPPLIPPTMGRSAYVPPYRRNMATSPNFV